MNSQPTMGAILFLLFLGTTSATTVRFFDGANFTGLFYESASTEPCTNISGFGWDKTSSVDVAGGCILLYKEHSCLNGRSEKIGPDTEYHDDLNYLEFDKMAKSFHFCNPSNGGAQVHVDLYNELNFVGTLVTYRDVCSCTNLPTYAHNLVSSVNNHGNCIMLYKEPNCMGGSTKLRGGNTAASLDLATANFDNVAKSIGLCDERPLCTRFSAEIVRFELNADPLDILRLEDASESVEMAAKTTLRNNGSATVTQEYTASKSITESVEIERVQSLISMDSVSTSSSFTVETTMGIPFFAKTRISKTLSEAYTYTNVEGSQESEKYTHEENRVFTAKQIIEIPPCTGYEVSSYVKITENFPVQYVLYSNLKGMLGKRMLRADELKERLTEMEYVEDVDDFTILAKSTSTITGSFGVVAAIDGVGEPMRDCQLSNHVQPEEERRAATVKEMHVPFLKTQIRMAKRRRAERSLYMATARIVTK